MHSCQSCDWLKPCKHRKEFSIQKEGGRVGTMRPCVWNTACGTWLHGSFPYCVSALVWRCFDNINIELFTLKIWFYSVSKNNNCCFILYFPPSGTGVLIRPVRRWHARCTTGRSCSGSTRRAAGRRDVREAGERRLYHGRYCCTINVSFFDQE